MAELTEAEIFDCLSTNFRLAAEDCEKLAVTARTGPAYHSLRDKLELLEGACRQASVWRQDSRWLQIGLMMAHAHKVAGDWLRGMPTVPGGPRVRLAAGHRHPLFLKLAENLRAGSKKAEEMRTNRTGRVGMILPPMQAAPLRDTTPVGWRRPSGLIVPSGASVA